MDMINFYNEFLSSLDEQDKERCVNLALSKLNNNEISVVALYNDILAPALKTPFCRDKSTDLCIWEEHLRTSIVRTVIECSYPFVIAEKRRTFGDSTKGIVIVLCPQEEYHEIGARMVADFFTLCGFSSAFIGANTPIRDILDAIKYLGPVYVAISVSVTYNLMAARRTIKKIADLRTQTGQGFLIIVGGNAFTKSSEIYRELGADNLLQTYNDIKQLTGKDKNALV